MAPHISAQHFPLSHTHTPTASTASITTASYPPKETEIVQQATCAMIAEVYTTYIHKRNSHLVSINTFNGVASTITAKKVNYKETSLGSNIGLTRFSNHNKAIYVITANNRTQPIHVGDYIEYRCENVR